MAHARGGGSARLPTARRVGGGITGKDHRGIANTIRALPLTHKATENRPATNCGAAGATFHQSLSYRFKRYYLFIFIPNPNFNTAEKIFFTAELQDRGSLVSAIRR